MCSPTVTIATSIMPVRIEAQQTAINSWLSLGFDVVSVNVPGEVEHLQDEFPGVRFERTTRQTASVDIGSYVYLAEMFSVLIDYPGEVCGIVNSDVSLLAESNLCDFVCKYAAEAMVFGSRIDVSAGNPSLELNNSFGFDFFFFNKEILHNFPRGNFYLGMPWWDFWFPLTASSCGIQLKRLFTPVAYHVIHDVGWTDQHLEKFWYILSQSCAEAASAHGGSAVNASRLTYAIDHDMARGAEILRNYLQYATESLFLPYLAPLANTVTLNAATFKAMKEQLVTYEERLAGSERSLAAVYASSSWRLTEPLRILKSNLKKLLR